MTQLLEKAFAESEDVLDKLADEALAEHTQTIFRSRARRQRGLLQEMEEGLGHMGVEFLVEPYDQELPGQGLLAHLHGFQSAFQ